MISCACGRKSIGIVFSENFFPNRPVAISGVCEEVTHVSKTSFSGSNSLPLQRVHFFFGLSFSGSTGRSFSSGSATAPHFLQYQAGIGIPKYLCLETHQSHFNPFIQCSSLWNM